MKMAALPDEYKLVSTDDGSLTLEVAGQAMHSKEGALAESLYVYGEALELAKSRGIRGLIASMGLGLGYNELIAAHSLGENYQLISFESDEFLRENFLGWVKEEVSPLAPLYDEVLDGISKSQGVGTVEIRCALQMALQEGHWKIQGEFQRSQPLVSPASIVFYDFYSVSRNPEVWSSNFLIDFLNQSCAKTCLFATYAALGNLNRALRVTGFKRLPKPGFGEKRESTWALRESEGHPRDPLFLSYGII
jgi:tRNA U34 5-methylaminomethyl-2-thiouridine-forming methyltransferase MnmC